MFSWGETTFKWNSFKLLISIIDSFCFQPPQKLYASNNHPQYHRAGILDVVSGLSDMKVFVSE